MAQMESMADILERIAKAVREDSPTPTDTEIELECEFCQGSGIIGGAPYRSCPNCDRGMHSLLGAVGLAGFTRLYAFTSFDPEKQPATKDRQMQHIALANAKQSALHGKKSLILSGPVGVGKTHLATAAAIEGYRALGSAYYVTAAKFNRKMLDFSEERWVRDTYVEDLGKVKLLCFDDLGAGAGEKQSDYIQGQWEVLIDMRYERDLPTIVTTNFTRDEFRARVGVRTFDRLMDGGEFCYMPGVSMRQQSK